MPNDYNPYAPPAAAFDDAPAASEGVSSEFYVVSTRKFWALFVLTFGLYELYWFYKNWARYRAATGERIWPVARAVFAIFFTHRLFTAIDLHLRQQARAFHWEPRTLATAFVVVTIVDRILDRLSMKSIASPYVDIASIALLPVIGFTVAGAQRAINVACGDPNGASNDRFTALNILWMLLGVGLWGMVLVGTFVE